MVIRYTGSQKLVDHTVDHHFVLSKWDSLKIGCRHVQSIIINFPMKIAIWGHASILGDPRLPSQTQGPPGHCPDQRHGAHVGKSMSVELGVLRIKAYPKKGEYPKVAALNNGKNDDNHGETIHENCGLKQQRWGSES